MSHFIVSINPDLILSLSLLSSISLSFSYLVALRWELPAFPQSKVSHTPRDTKKQSPSGVLVQPIHIKFRTNRQNLLIIISIERLVSAHPPCSHTRKHCQALCYLTDSFFVPPASQEAGHWQVISCFDCSSYLYFFGGEIVSVHSRTICIEAISHAVQAL